MVCISTTSAGLLFSITSFDINYHRFITRLLNLTDKNPEIKMRLCLVSCSSALQVDLVVHPSVQPNDERVTQAIEQIRFRISSSYSAVR